ncbi:MAG TPA: nuclear transport factor 2 family protein [Gemmatimonadales bacterium]|nr:nuclear transport factor 2 family protein [Gemmatimonadales bacterium]
MSVRTSLSRALLFALMLAPSLAFAQGIAADRQRLRTAMDDLRALRTEYVEMYNKKDAAGVTNLYADDAIVIQPDGTMLTGTEEIGKAMTEESKDWAHAVIESDTLRVYGSTAVDIGSFTTHPAGGGEQKMRYTSVLRRGMNGWKLTHVVVMAPTK